MSASAVMTVWTANRKACVRLSAIALPKEADWMGFDVVIFDNTSVEETMIDCNCWSYIKRSRYYPPSSRVL